MRSIYSVEDMLKKIFYPDPSGGAAAGQAAPLKVFYTLPEYIYINENDDIRVGWWDSKANVWSNEGIEELQYDKTNRVLQFSTLRLAPFSYLQDRWTDYPYRSWKMRCIQNETCLIDIEGKRANFTFEVGPGFVSLIENKDPELKHIVGKKFHPGVLLHELSKSGIHLMPVDEDAKGSGIKLKSRDAEERAIMDISTTVRAFAFRSSKWNKDAEEENVIIKIRENLEFDREFFEDYEPDWKYIMWFPNKVTFVTTSDASDELRTDILEGNDVRFAC